MSDRAKMGAAVASQMTKNLAKEAAKILNRCKNKETYITHGEAKRVAYKWGKQRGHRYQVYRCPRCRFFHLTTRDREKKAAA